jgi:phosphatidylglycerol:prolipoprotein diacylglycerol transferase
MYPQPSWLPWASSYGVALVLALVACWSGARRLAPAYGVDSSHVDLAVPAIFILGAIGARVLSAFLADDAGNGLGQPISHVRFRLFGLLLFAAPLLFAYARLSGHSFRRLADLFALPVLLWLTILRIGCFLAGCCWGDLARLPEGADPATLTAVLTWPWLSGDWVPGVSFPAGSYAFEQQLAMGLVSPDAGGSLPVHPTQLYEMLLLLPLLAVLRRFAADRRPSGQLALAALGGYACLRFVLEFVRADSVTAWSGLTATQLICVVLLLSSVMAGRLNRGFAPRIPASS